MQKTVKEWLEELPEPYRSQALENHEKYPIKDEAGFVIDTAGAVLYTFHWDRTPQGWDYWDAVYNSLVSGRSLAFPAPTERQTAEALLKEFKEHCTKNYSNMNGISNYAIQDFIKSKYGKG